MIIQIDTNNLSDTDLYFLKLLINPANLDELDADQRPSPSTAQSLSKVATGITATTTQAQAAAGKTRTRRTKLEIAFDDALAAYEGPNTGEGREWKALLEARDALAAKDPDNERIKWLAGQEAPIDEDAQAEAGEEPDEELAAAKVTDEELAAEADVTDAAVTIQDITTLATELIGKDRDALKGILKDFGVPRVSAVPEDQYNKLAAALTKALA